MKPIKEYMCDGVTPSYYEIKECVDIVEKENCIIKLIWSLFIGRWDEIYIKKGMTIDDCNCEINKKIPSTIKELKGAKRI